MSETKELISDCCKGKVREMGEVEKSRFPLADYEKKTKWRHRCLICNQACIAIPLEKQVQPKEEPDEELVEKILNVGFDFGYYGDQYPIERNKEREKEAKAKIRTLLQSHRPIQVDEIMKMLGQYINLKGQDKGKIAFEAQIRKLLEAK